MTSRGPGFKSKRVSDFSFIRGVLSSLLPLRIVGRSNFDKGLHNLITLIQKRHKLMIELLCYIMESSVDSNEKRNTIYILMISCITKNFYEVVHTLQISYVYIYIKCIVTNKHASRVLEYNYTNSKKICT